jgi:hypothetical protein
MLICYKEIISSTNQATRCRSAAVTVIAAATAVLSHFQTLEATPAVNRVPLCNHNDHEQLALV